MDPQHCHVHHWGVIKSNGVRVSDGWGTGPFCLSRAAGTANHWALAEAIWTGAGLGAALIPGWLIKSWLPGHLELQSPSKAPQPGASKRQLATREGLRSGGIIISDNTGRMRGKVCIWKQGSCRERESARAQPLVIKVNVLCFYLKCQRPVMPFRVSDKWMHFYK